MCGYMTHSSDVYNHNCIYLSVFRLKYNLALAKWSACKFVSSSMVLTVIQEKETEKSHIVTMNM